MRCFRICRSATTSATACASGASSAVSARLAVFNEARIEQVGPPAEVYEHPATEFVAGFVGVSNVLERGSTRFTVRPEKIRMLPDDGSGGEAGVIRDVVYVGVFTRYHVALDDGGGVVV